MPATTYNTSTGVKVLVDRVHHGPGQAGNKSALTYRCDIGVPGYTGFIPQTAAIPLQVKGSTKYIGRTTDGMRQDAISVCPQDYHTTSWYQKQFQADPAAYHKPSKDNGGYWIAKNTQSPHSDIAHKFRTAAESRLNMLSTCSHYNFIVSEGGDCCTRTFNGNSTYQCELQHGGPTAHQQLSSTVGLRSTVSCYDGARRGVSSGSIKSLPASVRQPLGFRTMYSSMYGEQIELTQAYGGALSAAAPRPATASCTSSAERATEPLHSQTVLTAHAPKEDVGSHTTDFGAYGDDPLSRSVGAATEMSQAATTYDLAAGTARSTKQLPGYTGFIPESDHNALACYEASAMQQPRQDGKAASMLFTLDQYSRQRVPLYTGHRPTAMSNLTVEEPAHGPTRQTTQGYANFRATQRPHTVDNSNFLDSRKGTMGFFNAGSSLFASENGLAEAQRFFQSKRGRRAGH